MIQLGMQVLLTLLFVGAGLLSLVRLVVDRGVPMRVCHALHVVMSGAMVGMCWPWRGALPPALQFAVFSLAALWFIVLAVAQLRPRAAAGPLRDHSALYPIAHAAMSIGMALMVGDIGSSVPPTHLHHQTLMSAAVPSGHFGALIAAVAAVILLAGEQALRLRRRLPVGGARLSDLGAGMAMGGGMAAMATFAAFG